MATSRADSGSSGKLSEAISEAQNIVRAAEKRAAELNEESEKIHREAWDRGYKEGFVAGEAKAASTAIRLIEENSTISDNLAEQAARLALAICPTIIEEHVKTDPEVVKKIARRALQESVIGDSVTVLVHPDDQSVLEKAADQLRSIAGGVNVAIDIDSSLTRGGCIVRTDFGEVDASIGALLGSLAARLGIRRDE